jgi:hypothetical protein
VQLYLHFPVRLHGVHRAILTCTTTLHSSSSNHLQTILNSSTSQPPSSTLNSVFLKKKVLNHFLYLECVLTCPVSKKLTESNYKRAGPQTYMIECRLEFFRTLQFIFCLASQLFSISMDRILRSLP